jgi:hypothetical protein
MPLSSVALMCRRLLAFCGKRALGFSVVVCAVSCVVAPVSDVRAASTSPFCRTTLENEISLDQNCALDQFDGFVDGGGQCIVNSTSAPAKEGFGHIVKFPHPTWGYCEGRVEQHCATHEKTGYNNFGATYDEIPVACYGGFSEWNGASAKPVKALEQELEKLKANIKALADSNDALTKRLNAVESKGTAPSK